MVENKVVVLPVEGNRPRNNLAVGRSVVKENHGSLERKHYCRRGQRADSTSSTNGVLIGASSLSNFSTASPNAVKKLKGKELEISNRNYVDLTADSPQNDGKILTFSADTSPPGFSFLRRHHCSSYSRPKAAVVPNRSYVQLPADVEILDLGLELGQTTEPTRGCTRFSFPVETRDEDTACNKERADGQREEPNRLENVGTSSGGCYRRRNACKEKKDKEPVPIGTNNQLNGSPSGPEQLLVLKRKRSLLTDAGTSRQRFKPPHRVRDCSTRGSSFGGMERPIDVESLESPISSAAAKGNASASPMRARQIEEDELLAKFLQEDYGLEAETGNTSLDDAQLAQMLQEEENAKYMQQTVQPASQVDHGSIMRAARREMQRVLPIIRPPATRPTASSSRMRILRNLHDRSRQQMGRGRRLGGSTTNSNDRLLHFPEGLDLETVSLLGLVFEAQRSRFAPFKMRALAEGFPDSWTEHTIVPIHKSGDVMDVGTYRTIMIGPTLAKLYGAVLEEALSTLAETEGLRAPGQAGFRRSFSTIDRIFTLRCLIDQTRVKKRRLYCCFVDFRKAFDTVPRERLFRRLMDLGVGEELIWGIYALYEHVFGRVKCPGGISDTLVSTIGVKQGCPLSPTLLGLYIDEIVDFIQHRGGDGVEIGGTTVHILLYADDIVLVAESAEGLHCTATPISTGRFLLTARALSEPW
ncbi:hypothetical protein L7F22_062990 [Adiantum nelumboides]|nr:hypothetical protein [Adiantum nelumboides]